MPLVKDVEIIELIRARTQVAYRAEDSAKTPETKRIWKHRKQCYSLASYYIRMAEGPCKLKPPVEPDFYGEDLGCLRD